MDREILLAGVGGQGVQLAAKVLALAGMKEGREVMQFSMFGGTMRGGSSECTVVLADAPVEAPPIVPHAWAGIALHASGLAAIERKLRPGGLLVCEAAALPAQRPGRADGAHVPVAAARLAAECGHPAGQSLVALAAFCRLTAIVAAESLASALADLLPAYRRQTLAANQACLRAGADAVGDLAASVPAWPGSAAAAAGDAREAPPAPAAARPD